MQTITEKRIASGQGNHGATVEGYKKLNERYWKLVRYNAEKEVGIAPIRKPILPLIRTDNLCELHYVESTMGNDERIVLHAAKELAQVISKVDKSIMNMEVPYNAPVGHVLRLLLERYQKITKAKYLDIRLDDTYAFNFSSMAAGYNPNSHYHFHAWVEHDERKADMYAVALEPLLNKMYGRKEEKLLRMLITLLYKHKIVQYISGIEDMCTEWLENRLCEGEFDDKSTINYGYSVVENVIEYRVGGIRQELDSLFSEEARNNACIDEFEELVKAQKSWNTHALKMLRIASVDAIKAIRSGVTIFDYQYLDGDREEGVSVDDTFIFLWSWKDHVGCEIKEHYQMQFNEFGGNELAAGIYNAVNKPFEKPLQSKFPKQIISIIESLTSI